MHGGHQARENRLSWGAKVSRISGVWKLTERSLCAMCNKSKGLCMLLQPSYPTNYIQPRASPPLNPHDRRKQFLKTDVVPLCNASRERCHPSRRNYTRVHASRKVAMVQRSKGERWQWNPRRVVRVSEPLKTLLANCKRCQILGWAMLLHKSTSPPLSLPCWQWRLKIACVCEKAKSRD